MKVYTGTTWKPLDEVINQPEVAALIQDFGLELSRASYGSLYRPIRDDTIDELVHQVELLVKELCSYCKPLISCEAYVKRNHYYVHKSYNDNAQLSFDWN